MGTLVAGARRTTAWSYALGCCAAGLLAAGLPLVAYGRLMLCHFYVRGAFVLDSGLFAALLWHADPALTQPDSIGGGSYFAVHATPLFLAFDALSWLLPLSAAQYFALVFGLSHALLALAGFWLALSGAARGGGWAAPWLAALCGLGLAFSGLTVAMALYPHPEMMIAVCFLLFAAALAQGRMRLAGMLFGCGLLVREDAGLHYLAVLALMIALDALRGAAWREQRARIGFAAAGLAWALAMLATQRLAFPDHVSAFAQNYVGDPPFAHLTAAQVGHRLLYALIARPYIVWPMLASFVWAWLARAPALAIGYLACLPWLLLQLLAASPFAATLSSYYAFPSLIGLAWPLLAAAPGFSTAATSRHPLAGFAVLVALTLLPARDLHDPGRLPVPDVFLTEAPALAAQTGTERAVAALVAARPLLRRLLVDNSVAALAPRAFRAGEFSITPGMRADPASEPDTVAYFADGYDAERLRDMARSFGLGFRYAVPGTMLRIAAARRLDEAAPLAGLLQAVQETP